MYVAVKAFIFFIFRGLEITSDTSLRQIRQQVCWVSRLLDLIFTTEKQRVNNSQKKKIFLVCVMNLLLTVPFTASTTKAMEMNRAMTSSVDLNTLHN